MVILKFLLRNHVFSILLFLALFIFGIISFLSLKVELLPEIKLPAITVITPYYKGNAEEIESLVTEKIENSLSTIDGLNNIRSLSSSGYSVVELFFEWGHPLDRAVIDVRKNLDLVKNTLPREAERSTLIRGISEAKPTVLLTVDNFGYSSLNFENELKKNLVGSLKQIEGAGKVEIKGLIKNQINISLDSQKLSVLGLSFQEVADQISSHNITGSAGVIEDDLKEYTVKIESSLRSVEQIKNIPILIPSENPAYIKLHELGNIEWGKEKTRSYAKLNEKKVVLVYLYKESRANTISFVAQTTKKVNELNSRYQGKIKTNLLYDQGKFISESIEKLFLTTLIGILAGIIILYFFYRSWLLSIIIILSIPISFIVIFFLMYFTGISINLMTLGGMALGSGMILDASVIVLDRLLKVDYNQKNLIDPIVDSVQVVFGSILSSTLSTLVVFIPIIFLKGLLSTIFKEMALTVTFSLIASILYSITFLPVLIYLIAQTSWKKKLIQTTHKKIRMKRLGKLFLKLALIFTYRPIQILVVIMTFVSVFAFLEIDKELIPYTNMGKVNLKVELLPQSSIKKTEEVERELFEYLNQLPLNDKLIFTEAGQEDNVLLFYENETGINRFVTTLVYSDNLRIKNDLEYFLNQEFISGNPSIRIQIEEEKPAFADFLFSPLSAGKIIVAGNNRRELSDWVSSIETPEERAYKQKPSYRLLFENQSIAIKNINKLQVAGEIWNWIQGNKNNSITLDEDQFIISLQLPEEQKQNFHKLMIKSESGVMHPLNSFSYLDKSNIRTDYYRLDHRFIEYVNKNHLQTIQSNLKSIPSSTIEVLPSSQEKEISRSQNNILYSLLLSIFLIYMTISAKFQSFTRSLNILFIIIPCIFFTIVILLLLSKSLNVFSGIGLILIAGSSVNNAILIFESLSQNLSQFGKNATLLIEHTIQERIVPVSITTFTTIATLMPIAINTDRGNEFNSLIAICLISGLIISIFFSMVFLPGIVARKAINE